MTGSLPNPVLDLLLQVVTVGPLPFSLGFWGLYSSGFSLFPSVAPCGTPLPDHYMSSSQPWLHIRIA